MRKKLAAVSASLLIALSVTPVIAVGQTLSNSAVSDLIVDAVTFRIAEKKTVFREEGLEIKGKLPVVSGLSRLDTEINTQITNIYHLKVAAAKDAKARSITFNYEYKKSHSKFSLLIYATTVSATSKAEVNSINFDIPEQRFITVNDILGINGLQLAGKVISYRIKSDPDRYYPNFPGLQENHAFEYVNNDVVFLFDSYQIAPGSEGIVRFSLNTDNMLTCSVEKAKGYWIRDDIYGLKMVSLRAVCLDLKYSLGWDPILRTISVMRKGETNISMIVGQNNYMSSKTSGLEKYVKKSLEAAPVLVDGVSYVPISFFDQVMDLVAYTALADDANTILFSTYLEYLELAE